MPTVPIRLLFGLLALLAAVPAAAGWHEASSDHFVIYADDKEADIRTFAENLERYHSAMALVTGATAEKPSPSNRVTIYVVGGQSNIRALTGGSRFISGFYVPGAGRSRAFVQTIHNTKGYPHIATIVLLHEYAHHFFLSSSRLPMPRWLGEGAAEFFASASFHENGGIMVGHRAYHRWRELLLGDPVPLRDLLDPAAYDRRPGGQEGFYGRSWLLYHYLTFAEDRKGQLATYQQLLLEGTAPLDAARTAFGDLNALDLEVTAYWRGPMKTFAIGPDKLGPVSPVALRKLTEAEAAIMPLVIRMQGTVSGPQAADVLAEARALAERFPEDPAVLSALAEAEFGAGNDVAAIAAADKALAADPARIGALVQKGQALFRQARSADDKAAAYAAAMQPFEALNRIENDHPLPLIHYYRSFVERGVPPPENARAALERASQLAPFDEDLQLATGVMLIDEGKHAAARALLAPVAANPHGTPAAVQARSLLAAISPRTDGNGNVAAEGPAQAAQVAPAADEAVSSCRTAPSPCP